MLLPFRTHHLTHSVRPSALHLGDLIGLAQRFHREALRSHDDYLFYANTRCPCCGVHTGAMVRDILSLLDTRVRFVPGPVPKEALQCTPEWFGQKRVDSPPYAKAKDLPAKGSHVVCQ